MLINAQYFIFHFDCIHSQSDAAFYFPVPYYRQAGATAFADSTAAYGALPEEWKKRLEGLTGNYVYAKNRGGGVFPDQANRR